MNPNEILVVLPFSTGDAIQAERLCDWIYMLSGNKKEGSILLLADSEVHAELHTKVRLSAEVAFENVALLSSPKTDRINKPERVNNLFRTAAWIVAKQYRLPWLWLEPDCVPLKQGWLGGIAEAYHNQPKRYMGGFLKISLKDRPEQIIMSRIAVYPMGAAVDIDSHCGGPMPFNFAAGSNLTDRATKSKVFQQISYNHETDYDKIRPDALLLHTDKTGNLIQHLRAAAKNAKPKEEPKAAGAPAAETGNLTITDNRTMVIPAKRRGRPQLNAK